MQFSRVAAAILVLATAAPSSAAPPPVRKPKASVPASLRTSPEASAWMRRLSLRQQVAQLVIVPFYGDAPGSRTRSYRDFLHLVRDVGVGGLILLNRVQNGTVRAAEPYATGAFLNRMQRMARIPLIVAGDFERGASMRLSNTTRYPHAMAYGAARDLAATRATGAATAREARALGIHWIFAPVADVNNNPDNPIINIRSYGEDPGQVSQHVRAFVEGAHADPRNLTLLAVKHFPGHGDTSTDSHLGLARINADRERLSAVELAPFAAAISQGVDSVMTAHLTVPALEPLEIPATVSSNIVTGLLRHEMGFRGIVVTDAMDMAGLTRQFGYGEAAVRSLEAGTDVLVMPPRPEAAIEAVVAAILRGRLSRTRVQESVARILAAKVRLGLHKKRLVDLEQISEQIDSPESTELAQSVADHAITLVKHERALLPAGGADKACLLALAEGRYSSQGRRLIEEVQSRAPNLPATWLDPTAAAAELDEVAQRAAPCEAVVVAAFVSASAYRGDVALPGGFSRLVNILLDRGQRVTMIALGNPYLLRSFPRVSSYLATFSTTQTSEVAAVKALFGEIAIGGRLPVSIPGIARVGDGIPLAARARL